MLLLVQQGYSNPEIARRLDISRETVKTHLKRIFRKFGVRSRWELALRARDRQEQGRGKPSPSL